MSDFTNPLLFGVGCSFACSGLFYNLYQSKKRELTKLKQTPVFRPDHHMAMVLKSSPHKRLQYVAVEGLVESDEKSLSSQFVPRCFGVIQKIKVTEHGEYWNPHSKTWSSRPTNRNETNNSVPFSLICPDSYMSDFHVQVQDPLQGSGYFLERVYHRVRRAEEGLVNVVLQGISGERAVAKEESEEMLRVGSNLTVFGEVVLEGGHGRLQPPRDGREYLFIPTDYKSFIERHERSASMWKMLTAMTGIIGTSILAGVIYDAVRKRDNKS
ncbi:mitochondrial ubiquitin ligase activator of nfkb 1-A isoform X1 [Stigmatopora argus]